MESEQAEIRQQAVTQVANLTNSPLAGVFGDSLSILKQIMDIVQGVATVRALLSPPSVNLTYSQIHPAAEAAVKAVTLMYKVRAPYHFSTTKFIPSRFQAVQQCTDVS